MLFMYEVRCIFSNKNKSIIIHKINNKYKIKCLSYRLSSQNKYYVTVITKKLQFQYKYRNN